MLLAWQEIFYAKRFPGRVYLLFVTNETEVIAVWKNSQIRENGHISKTKTENKNHQEGKNVYVSHLSASVR